MEDLAASIAWASGSLRLDTLDGSPFVCLPVELIRFRLDKFNINTTTYLNPSAKYFPLRKLYQKHYLSLHISFLIQLTVFLYDMIYLPRHRILTRDG